MSGNITIAILSAAGVAAALSGPPSSTSYVSRAVPAAAALTTEQLQNYAETLIEVRKVQRNLRDALTQAPADAAAALQQQARVTIAEILLRHEIGVRQFNQISMKVESDPTLRHTVRQFVMHEQVGI
jgi:hypothetical protein